MKYSIKKIGIIQNAPLPGDFSNNLRAIVQGYRECLDHGADIVVAPAAALCGLEPQSLATRSSFLAQTQAAAEDPVQSPQGRKDAHETQDNVFR